MKRTVAIIMALILAAFVCAGCSQQPKENNPSPAPASTSSSSKAERQDVIVKETGFSVDSIGATHYGLILENPNENYSLGAFQVNVTARNANGQIIGTDTAHPTYLFALQKTAVCGYISTPEAPATIDATISANASSWGSYDGVQGGDADAVFQVTNLADIDKGYGMASVTGEVVNNSDKEANSMIVNVVVRDANGAIVSGEYTYVHGSIPAHSSGVFEAMFTSMPEHASVEAYPMMYA